MEQRGTRLPDSLAAQSRQTSIGWVFDKIGGIKGKGTLSSVTMGAPPPKPPGLRALIMTPGEESEKAKRSGSVSIPGGRRSSVAGEAIPLACAGTSDDEKKASQCENDDCLNQSQSHWRHNETYWNGST
jgi:hypothetical protein